MSSEETKVSNGNKVKTLAIRLEPDVHAQLSLVAQLRGSNITEEIRSAIEAHIEATKSDPELAAQADTAREEIEREAASRREAIATMFGSDSQSQQTGSGQTKGKKTAKTASSGKSSEASGQEEGASS